MASAPPPRPRPDHPEDLGFERQRMVRWLSPRELVQTAGRVLLSAVFGAYADKREVQAGLVAAEPMDYAAEREIWIDYVADLGDGFDSTYSIASLLAEPKLDLNGAGAATRRGQLLVMGGDEVYPTASVEQYENRMMGPYRAALPYVELDPPHLYAIPGNHDWYDGLTSFMRVFCQREWIGGWQTQQTRSYFAAKLPHGWWLWGIDIQFDTYIDEPQFQYFERVAREGLQKGDQVILCSAKPSWVEANEDLPEAFANLDYFERKILRDKARVLLALSGDSHHYAHYEAVDGCAQRLTAGGGGAFLSATHHLPDTLALPPELSRARGKTKPPVPFRFVSAFPSKEESRAIRRRIVNLPFKNPSFWALVGVVYLLYGWTIQSARRVGGGNFADVMRRLPLGDVAWGLLRTPLALVVTAVLVRGLVGFTKAEGTKKWVLGIAHAAAHLVVVVGTVWAAARLLRDVGADWAFTLGFGLLVGVGGGFLGSMVMAGYLFVADRFRCNANELFAAQRIEDLKCFLRIHIDAEGVLTVYPVGLRKVCRSWRVRQQGGAEDPWFEPADGHGPAPHLIEPPIRIDPRLAPPA